MHAVSEMQGELLASEEGREELETGLETVHATLRRTMAEREAARAEAELVLARLESTSAETGDDARRLEETTAALELLSDALSRTAVERDAIAGVAAESRAHIDDLVLDQKLAAEKNDRIFGRLEEAMQVSVEPLDEMFRKVGLDPDTILAAVRSGRGTPDALGPIRMSTKGMADVDTTRANAILGRLGDMDVYREAAERTPFSKPIRASVRNSSSYGPRWGRMHEGQDFAGSHGTDIYATADGVVIHAGRLSGYGNLIKIRHQFGIETRYAHLSGINVKVGQKVSRGDHIGDMGNTGRSTGTHLHYEVRVNGRAVDPMTYIRAAQDVL
jgi:murein DD-endopeptidase MepM/ murein hydrolase activator NlpD